LVQAEAKITDLGLKSCAMQQNEQSVVSGRNFRKHEVLTLDGKDFFSA